jgi:hypothetical protein
VLPWQDCQTCQQVSQVIGKKGNGKKGNGKNGNVKKGNGKKGNW